MKMTRQRKAIIDLFENNKKIPLSADLIYSKLPNNTMNLSTVYRILERLSDSGFLQKSIIEHTAHYYLIDDIHHHYLICLRCKEMKMLECLLDDKIDAIAQATKYKISHHDLTFYGICEECQKKHT